MPAQLIELSRPTINVPLFEIKSLVCRGSIVGISALGLLNSIACVSSSQVATDHHPITTIVNLEDRISLKFVHPIAN